MDISTLKEISVRKKIKEDAGKLKEKLSNETCNIIKLRVNQDATYWELRQSLATTQENLERLQKNMLELQMQYENVSAQYQEEIRRRPEVVNNLMGNRKMYAVLEANLSRIRASLQRSAADRNALAEAYAQATEKVKTAQAEYEKRIAATSTEARTAQERAIMKEEQCARMSECMSLINCRAEKTSAELDRVRDQRDCLAEKMTRHETIIQEKEKTIQELREEIRRVANEFSERMERQRKAAAALEREAGAATALREALSQAESRNEILMRDSKRLSSELAVANDAAQKAATLKTQNQELQSNIDELKRNMSFLVDKSEEIVKELNVKTEKLKSVEEALVESKQETQVAVERISQLIEERDRGNREFEERITALTNEHAKEREQQNQEYEKRMKTGIDKIAEEIIKERNTFEKHISVYEIRVNERDDIIASLKLEIEELTKTQGKDKATISDLNNVLQRERTEKDERIAKVERSLAEKAELVTRLEEDLAKEKINLANANTTIEELKNKLEHDLEQQVAEFEKQLAEREEVSSQLRRDLAVEKERVSRAEDLLNDTRAELKTARADAAHALDNVRRLEASVRNKDDEASKQMKIILTARAENEQLQEKIRSMQDTINDIQKITHRKSPLDSSTARSDPPEQDVNTKALPPPHRGTPLMASAPIRRQMTPATAAELSQIYNMLSDTDSIDEPLHGSRRFNSMSHSIPLTPISSNPVKRRRKQPKAAPLAPVPDYTRAATPEPRLETPTEGRRKFFKTRRGNRDDPKKD